MAFIRPLNRENPCAGYGGFEESRPWGHFGGRWESRQASRGRETGRRYREKRPGEVVQHARGREKDLSKAAPGFRRLPRSRFPDFEIYPRALVVAPV